MEKLSLDEATKRLLEQVEPLQEAEEISLWDAKNRILAEDVFATRNQPPFARSPLDGYAVQSEDIKSATKEAPARLTVIEEVAAGRVGQKQVTAGTAVRIMTGAPIPKGADAIVRQEDTDYGEGRVCVYQSVGHYGNYCFEGEDYRAGDCLMKKGSLLGAAHVGVLASLGLKKALVLRKARVALITTGDEIVLPGETLPEGKIYDSNLFSLGVQLQSWGVELTAKRRVGDEAWLVAAMIAEEAKDADMVITTGGVSVGKKDIMHDALKLLDGQRIFWRVAIKPGMPTLCARYKGKLILCLSGNPYAAAVNLELLARPLLAKLTGRKDLCLRRKRASLQNGYHKKSAVTRYVRAYYREGKAWIANGSNDSGVLSSLCGCNCLVEIPAGTGQIRQGGQVWVVMIG